MRDNQFYAQCLIDIKNKLNSTTQQLANVLEMNRVTLTHKMRGKWPIQPIDVIKIEFIYDYVVKNKTINEIDTCFSDAFKKIYISKLMDIRNKRNYRNSHFLSINKDGTLFIPQSILDEMNNDLSINDCIIIRQYPNYIDFRLVNSNKQIHPIFIKRFFKKLKNGVTIKIKQFIKKPKHLIKIPYEILDNDPKILRIQMIDLV